MILASLLLGACSSDDTAADDTSGTDDTGTPSDVAVPKLVINEFIADNKSYPDPDGDPTDTADVGEFNDWLEIYNADEVAVPLAGFYLTDNFDQPTRWALPTTVELAPGQFMLFWCDKQPEQGPDTHTDFSLSKDGETIGLYYAVDGGGAWANKVEYGEMATDLSSARVPDGSLEWQAGVTPTPGTSNGG